MHMLTDGQRCTEGAQTFFFSQQADAGSQSNDLALPLHVYFVLFKKLLMCVLWGPPLFLRKLSIFHDCLNKVLQVLCTQ